MSFQIWISIFAIFVSAVSFVISFWHSRKSFVSGIMPVLIFAYDNDDGWTIKNIGNGPALNILVARKPRDGDWFDPVRIPPLSKDSKFILSWLGHSNEDGLGAIYMDFQDRKYSSTCQDDHSRISDKHQLPVWGEQEIKRHWNYSGSIV